jgi:hypothetical protein
MRKILSICMVLTLVLCVMGLNAQNQTTLRSQTQSTAFDLNINHSSDLCNDSKDNPSRATWDLLWSFSINEVQGSGGNFAPFLWGDYLYITKWAASSMGQVHKFSRSGSNWTYSGQFVISGASGSVNLEGFCTDGTFLYCCTGASNIYKIDPATMTIVGTIPVSGQIIDAVAYDADNDCFWIAEYQTSSAKKIAKTGGTVLKTLTTSLNITGLAWEKFSDGTPYLWMLNAVSSGTSIDLSRWNLTTDAFQANAHSNSSVPLINGVGTGLYTGLDPVLGKNVLIGITEGASDVIFCYELSSGAPPTDVTITTDVFPTGAGTVTGGGTYAIGAPVTLTATANTDWEFVNWFFEGTAISDNPLTFNASTDATYTAHFQSTLPPGDCDPPTNLDVEYGTDCDMAALTWDPPAKGGRGVIWDNGPFITHPGGGAGGKDVSAFTVDGQALIGSNMNKALDYSIADNFTLTTESSIETIEFYSYQTGSGNTSTITGVYVRIWDNAPNAGGNIIWGDMTTDRMISTSWSDVYRVTTTLTNTDRPIFKIIANVNVVLPAGNYWVDVAATGSATSGPWANPVEVVGAHHTGNALQHVSTGWQAWIDSSSGNGTSEPFDLPFVIYGSTDEPEPVAYNVYRDGEKLTDTPIEDTFYDDTTCDFTKEHKWEVKVACDGGGESNATSKTMDACISTPLPPCEPVTEVNDDFNADAKEITITWTAPALTPVKYEIFKDGISIAEATAAEYTDDLSELEEGEYTIEYCVLPIYDTDVCEGDVEKACITANFVITGIKGYCKTAFSIVPNPAHNNITISAVTNFHTLEVVSFLGQKILSVSNDSNTAKLDVSNLSNGVYFVRIISETGISVKKFVKQ